MNRTAHTLILVAAIALASRVEAQQPASTLIQNALVIDGRGTPARRVSVRIAGDRIAAVGDLRATAADRIIDARGLALAPGFIDTHSHHDRGLFDLLAQPGGSGAGIVALGMDEADVERLMQWPWANVCSDGTSTGLHPRGFGSFPRVLGLFAREKKLFAMEEAVRKMSSLPAANVGIANRGVIEPGYFADLVLFDPAVVIDRSTFEEPQAIAVGIVTVWVNGEVVFESGAATGSAPGRAIRRGS